MPRSDDAMFFSFDIGPVHFISISTEFYFFLEYGVKQVVNQYQWLENDLKVIINYRVCNAVCIYNIFVFQIANKPENRAQRPWIIIYGHRPMYCSNNDNDDCTNKESFVIMLRELFLFFQSIWALHLFYLLP